MSKTKYRRVKVAESQQKLMLEFMRKHPQLLSNKQSHSFNWRSKQELWRELTDVLNANGYGPIKTPGKWMKTWSDWKFVTKAKAARILQDSRGTRCTSTSESLADVEEQLMELISCNSDMGTYSEKILDTTVTTKSQKSARGTRHTTPVVLSPLLNATCIEPAATYPEIVIESSDNPSDCSSAENHPSCGSAPNNMKKKKRKFGTQKLAYNLQTNTFLQMEERNVAAQENIAAALAQLASAVEAQATAMGEIADSLSKVASAVQTLVAGQFGND
ncbi:uncharacterized protein LOC134539335 [Bacillus rossius redtenbacheri]|uniref:uncharacterized protein LOC134539335 n=1 Tax=Bacillus rossius redtenbacheri TaxID=93214 RepID=UPI002FDCAC2C